MISNIGLAYKTWDNALALQGEIVQLDIYKKKEIMKTDTSTCYDFMKDFAEMVIQMSTTLLRDILFVILRISLNDF